MFLMPSTEPSNLHRRIKKYSLINQLLVHMSTLRNKSSIFIVMNVSQNSIAIKSSLNF